MSMKTNHQLPLPEVLKQEYPLSKELQKAKLIENTEAFIEGRAANNCLLFGDSGTGKSSSIRRQRRHGLRIRQSSQKSP